MQSEKEQSNDEGYQLLTISLWLGFLILVRDWNYVQFVLQLPPEPELISELCCKNLIERTAICLVEDRRKGLKLDEHHTFTSHRCAALLWAKPRPVSAAKTYFTNASCLFATQ